MSPWALAPPLSLSASLTSIGSLLEPDSNAMPSLAKPRSASSWRAEMVSSAMKAISAQWRVASAVASCGVLQFERIVVDVVLRVSEVIMQRESVRSS